MPAPCPCPCHPFPLNISTDIPREATTSTHTCMEKPSVSTPRTNLYPMAYGTSGQVPSLPPFLHLKGQLLRSPGLSIKSSSVRYLTKAPSCTAPLSWSLFLLPGLALTKERILHTETPHSITYTEKVCGGLSHRTSSLGLQGSLV